jgi:hypothetical protein
MFYLPLFPKHLIQAVSIQKFFSTQKKIYTIFQVAEEYRNPYQKDRLKEPSHYPAKLKEGNFQRPKFQKESGLHGDLRLSLTKADFNSKFFQKNLAKINKKAEARKIYVTPELLRSIEADRQKQVAELYKQLKELKFQRIVANDKKTLHQQIA